MRYALRTLTDNANSTSDMYISDLVMKLLAVVRWRSDQTSTLYLHPANAAMAIGDLTGFTVAPTSSMPILSLEELSTAVTAVIETARQTRLAYALAHKVKGRG
jgi:hypothetical protein